MAITLTQQPQTYQPAYNPIFYQGLSGNYASAGFYYKVTITDIISSESASYRINPRPTDGYFIFDASPFAQNYFTNYIPINVYGWQNATGIRRFQVNVSEFNDANPVTPITSNDYYFYSWNAALDWKLLPDYSYVDYIYDSDGSPRSGAILSDLLDEKAYDDRSNLLYFLSAANNNDMNYIVVISYNTIGVNLTVSTIANPDSTSTNYRDKYVCVDVGLKGLENISSGLVTGSYPIIDPAATHYDVYRYFRTGGAIKIKTYEIKCSNLPVYTIHALMNNGNFRSVHFDKISEQSTALSKVGYKQIPYENTSNVYAYSLSSASEKLLSVTENRTIKLRTDWITEAECELYTQLASSPVSYLDTGSSTDYIQVIPIANSFKINTKKNKKLFNIELDYKYTMSSFRQRG